MFCLHELKPVNPIKLRGDVLDPEDILDFTENKYLQNLREFTVPHCAFWEVTYDCNLHCAHCGIDAKGLQNKELNTDESLKVLNNLSESGIRALMLVGGEPLLREDLIEIVKYAAKRFLTVICTNGVLLDKEYARRLRNAGFDICMWVSLDGASPETHDLVRGKGNFKRALEGIRNSIDIGFQTCVTSTISQLNFRELPDIINLALDLGVTIFSVTEFLPCGRGKNMAHFALSKEQRKEMYQYLIQRRQQKLPCMYILNDPYYFLSLEKEFQQRCFNPFDAEMVIGDLSGILYCGVKPNGEVMPHPGVRITIGDLREQWLKQIWEDSVTLKQLRDRKNLRGKCGRCEYKFVCGGSRATAFQLLGDMMAEDPRCWYEPDLKHLVAKDPL